MHKGANRAKNTARSKRFLKCEGRAFLCVKQLTYVTPLQPKGLPGAHPWKFISMRCRPVKPPSRDGHRVLRRCDCWGLPPHVIARLVLAIHA